MLRRFPAANLLHQAFQPNLRIEHLLHELLVKADHALVLRDVGFGRFVEQFLERDPLIFHTLQHVLDTKIEEGVVDLLDGAILVRQ